VTVNILIHQPPDTTDCQSDNTPNVYMSKSYTTAGLCYAEIYTEYFLLLQQHLYSFLSAVMYFA